MGSFRFFFLLILELYSAASFGQFYPKTKNYTAFDASVSGLTLKINKDPVGKQLAVGFRLSISQNFVVNNEWEIITQIGFSQSGIKYIRVYPTGIIDTINVYNSLQIFQNEIKLNYITTEVGIRKMLFARGSVRPFISLCSFGSFLLSANERGHELSGNGMFSISTTDIYYRINWGVEPELGVKIYLSNGNSFVIAGSYEIGLYNINKNSILIPQLFSNERTRAYSIKVSVPFHSK